MAEPTHPAAGRAPGGPAAVGPSRPFIGVLFRCAASYQRVYRDRTGTRYLARCPRCGKTVRFVVGEGGTNERFFEVEC